MTPFFRHTFATFSPLLAIFACGAGATKGEEAKLKPADLKIAINGNKFHLQGKDLDMPFELVELEKLLGESDRESKLLNWIYTWDELGLIAYCKPGTTQVIS